VPREDRVQVGVLGDALQRHVGHRLVDEARVRVGADMGRLGGGVLTLDLIEVELRGQQPLPRQGDGHPAGVDGDPAPAPLLGHVCGGAGAAGGVEDQIAGVGGHQ
jgi:hypothetical protein